MRAAGCTSVVRRKGYWQCEPLGLPWLVSSCDLLFGCSSEQNSGVIRIYDGRGDEKPLVSIDKLHRSPVHLMAVCLVFLTIG